MRYALALIGGCLMALLLFMLMLYMVAPPKAKVVEEPLTVANFVRAENSSDTATRTRQQAPQPPTPQTPQPPTPLTPMNAVPTPNLPTLDVSLPRLDVGVAVSNAPAPSLSGLSAGPSAPAEAPSEGPSGLDSEVVPLNDVRPRYPDRALERGIEGHVKLAFVITPDGRVENIRVLESNPSRVFDREARLAAARWRFAPRTENGLAVAREAVKTLHFRLEKRGR